MAVVMLAYNSGKYIQKALDSIIDQSLDFRDIQIIVVNDASNDNTKSVVEEYIKEYPKNITLINNDENRGPAYSRNVGLQNVNAEFVNFLDSDDCISRNAFEKAYLFLKNHEEIDIASIPIYYFGIKNRPHNLNFKFSKTQVINLDEHPEYIQLSGPSSFFRFERLKHYRFNENLRVSEDPLLINQMLIDNPNIGFINGAKYYYRQDTLQNSLIATSTSHKSYFTSRVDNYFIGLINYAINKKGYVPKFIQHILMYDLQWIVEIRFIHLLLSQSEIDELYDKIFFILKYIDSDVIYHQLSLPIELKHHLALLKDHGTAYRLNKDNFQEDFNLNTVYIDNYEFLDKDKIYISGVLTNFLRSTDVYAIADGKIYNTNKLNFTQRRNFSLDFDYGYNHSFDVVLPVKPGMEISFKTNASNLLIDYNQTSRLSGTSRYRFSKDYLSIDCRNHIQIIEKTITKGVKLELSVLKQILKEKKQGWRTGILLRILYFMFYFYFRNKHIWIFMDLPNSSGDNGYFLFKKAIKSDKLKNIKKYYVFSKSKNLHETFSEQENKYVASSKFMKARTLSGFITPNEEFERLKKIGNVLQYKSIKHRLYLLFADYIIASHPDNGIIYPFWGNYHHLSGLARSKTIFLQHGVTKDDISYWFNRYDKRIGLIVTVSDLEKESFLNPKYGYDESCIKVLGFPRLDFLEKGEDKKEIVLMPSWRRQHSQLSEDEFIQTDYFKSINELMNNEYLIKFLKSKGYRLIFKPHRNVLKFIDSFDIPDEAELGSEMSYNEIFNHASMMITDYSSVAFDFAYLKKPLIYYHHDDDYHFNLDDSYFKYDTMGFGPVATQIDELKDEIIRLVENDCQMDEKYIKRVDDFFKYTDKNNSKRVIDKILEFDEMFYY